MLSVASNVQRWRAFLGVGQSVPDEHPFTASARGKAARDEYVIPTVILGGITCAGFYLPITYHAIGLVYLLAVLAISMRVGRNPAVFAAVASALTWNCIFIPPRFSFRIVSFDDGLLLATYFAVAVSGSYWAARSRELQVAEHAREREAHALLQLIQAFATAEGFDAGVRLAIGQAEQLFAARVAIGLGETADALEWHPVAGLERGLDLDVAAVGPAGVIETRDPRTGDAAACAPLQRGRVVTGWVVVRGDAAFSLSQPGINLLRGFALQLGLLCEREKLRAAAEREALFKASNRLQRTLLDSVSHELNTPLAVLRSAAEELATDDNADRELLSTEIVSATSRLNRLMGNLVNRSRLESGPLQPKLDWCDAHDLFHSARLGTADLLEGRPVTIEIPADLPLVYADAVLLDQALINLVSNAARHTPSGSPIRLTAKASEAEVRLSVIDHGRGIPPALRMHLFDKFRRGADARSGGLGLGLSIALALVEAQHGQLLYEDNPAGGACFTVCLPAKPYEEVPSDEC